MDELSVLLGLIAVGAGWLLVHVRLLVRVVRAPRRGRLRWLAIAPPATPVIGWWCGARALSGAWVACALLYAWLRNLL